MGLHIVTLLRAASAAAILCAALLCGCADTLNVGGNFNGFIQVTSFTVQPGPGESLLRGGGQATFEVTYNASSWIGGRSFDLDIDFGGAAVNIIDQPIANYSHSITTTLSSIQESQTFTATARINDSNGMSGNPQTLTFNVAANN